MGTSKTKCVNLVSSLLNCCLLPYILSFSLSLNHHDENDVVSDPFLFNLKTVLGYTAEETSGAVGDHLPRVHVSGTWVGKKTQRL